jgi:predicted dehydrogenase
LNDRYRITAVYDQVARRAEIESHVLGARQAEGLTELIDRDDVDVLLLLTPQWFGLHSLELASTRGKPIFCALPIAGTDEWLDRIDSNLRASDSIFMPEFARRGYPVTRRLLELLATKLGKPRFVQAHVRVAGFDRYGQPGPSTQIAPRPLLMDPGTYTLDWCRAVFQAEPVHVQRVKGNSIDEADFEAVQLGFEDGGLVQIQLSRYQRTKWGDAFKHLPAPGFQVFAEHGAAWLEMPDRIIWTTPEGTTEERLPIEPAIGEQLLDQFHRIICLGEPVSPGWTDALAVARLILRLE